MKRKRIRHTKDYKIVKAIQEVHGISIADAWNLHNLRMLKSNMRYVNR
tara:strand:- start:1476 stop:1619 length:144 start_codon:yes stop_codon:yes gene_type:complete